MGRSPIGRLAIAAALLGCLAAPAPTLAQSTFGSSQTANASFGCETRPTFTEQSFDGFYRFLPSNVPDCTWYQAGIFGELAPTNTGGAPADGRISSVTVRSGVNPAPLRFVILRAFTASGTGNPVCCAFVTETTQPVALAPGTSTFAVNLPVEANTNPANGLRTQDFIGVSAVSGTGRLPLFYNGRNNLLTDYTRGNTVAGFFYPRLGALANDSGGGRSTESTPGFEVTMNWTFSTGGEVAILSQVLRERDGRVRLLLQCLLTTDCAGSVNLLTAPAGASVAAGERVAANRSVGSKKNVTIPAGQKRKVKIKLNKIGRRLAKRKKKVPLVVSVDLGTGTPSSKAVKLK